MVRHSALSEFYCRLDMADITTGTDEKMFIVETKTFSRWKSVLVYLKLLKYIIYNILRIVFNIAACIALKCSFVLKHLSNNLETPDIMEELTNQTPKNRCDSSFNQNIKDEELIEINKVNADTVNKPPLIESDLSLNVNSKNEEQVEINKFNVDIKNIILNTESDSFLDQNINEKQEDMNKVNVDIKIITSNSESDCFIEQNIINGEQVEINKVDSDIINVPLSTECDSSFDQNINNEQTETNLVYFNSIDETLNTEQTSLSNEETMNSKNPVSKYGVSDENINQTFVNEFDKDALNQKYACQLQEKETFSRKKSFVEYGTNSKGDKRKPRSSLDLITQTLKENKEKADKFALETKLKVERLSMKVKSNEYLKPEKVRLNKSESLTNEIRSFLKKEVEKNDSLDVTSSSCVNDSFYNTTVTNKRNAGDNHNYHESKRSNMKSDKQNRSNHKESRKHDNYENRKPLMKNDKLFNVIEKHVDILSLPPEYSLAYCIATDFYVASDFPRVFNDKFGHMGVLMDKYLRLGDVGEILSDENQYIFYLVVKKKILQHTISSGFEKTLYTLFHKMNELKLTKLAIPKSGLDKMSVSEAKHYISKVFARSNIEVTICLNPLQVNPLAQIKKNFTSLNLWEMESQTDLIMFINLEEMYLDTWNDEVVEKVNARYPFKDKLLNDITIKPMAAGDILSYKVDKEVLFCIFFKHDNPSYFECLEKAFKKMKSQLTGYRYLGVQQDPLNYIYKNHGISRHMALLKSVFSYKDAEIWICGDTSSHKIQMQQFQKVVNDSIEMNKIVSSKSHANHRFKTERKNYNTNVFDKPYDLVEDISHHKKFNDIPIACVNPVINTDNDISENWD